MLVDAVVFVDIVVLAATTVAFVVVVEFTGLTTIGLLTAVTPVMLDPETFIVGVTDVGPAGLEAAATCCGLAIAGG